MCHLRHWDMDLLLDGLGRTSVARVAEQHAQRVANVVDRQLVPEELSSRAGGDDSLGVGALVGSLRENQQRDRKGQSADGWFLLPSE